MDYNKHYNLLINKAKNRSLKGYKEKHHIIPKSLGGDDSDTNIVTLTAREHYLAHWLLYEIHKKSNITEMTYAFHMMSSHPRFKAIKSSRAYEECKKERSFILSKKLKGIKPHVNTAIGASIKNRGENNPAKRPDVRKKMSNSRKAYSQSKETILKSAASRRGKKRSKEASRKTQIAQSKVVISKDYNLNKSIRFQCVSDCAEYYKLFPRNLRKYIDRGIKVKKGRCKNILFEYE